MYWRKSDPEREILLEPGPLTVCAFRETRRASAQALSQSREKNEAYKLQTVQGMISSWVHFAILECLHLKDFEPNFKWIAAHLGLKAATVKQAVEQLELAGLLTRSADGKWRDVHENLGTTDGVQSKIIQRLHIDLMEKFKERLIKRPVHCSWWCARCFAADADLRAAEERALGGDGNRLLGAAAPADAAV